MADQPIKVIPPAPQRTVGCRRVQALGKGVASLSRPTNCMGLTV